MKAVVMAGGEGSRLRPLTINRPKPMVPLADRPVMAHTIELLKRHGITDIVVTVQYLATVIQDQFGDGSAFGVHIEYVVEETPLGTAGSVKNAEAMLQEPFLVISGDALTDIDLTELIRAHTARGAIATLTLKRVPNPLEYGLVITAEDGSITQFLEKPSWGEVFSDTVNTGIYMLDPRIFDFIPSGRIIDWSKDVFPHVLESGEVLSGHIADGYWTDVGSFHEYMRATADYLNGKVNLPRLGQCIRDDIWTDGDVEIAPDAELYGPMYLGLGVKIKSGAMVRGPTVIRDYTVVEAQARIEHSIIWRNSYVGERAELRGALIARQCNIKSRAMVSEGAVIGDHTVINNGAVIHTDVKIWPSKQIDEGARVTASLIWGSQGRRTLFGRYGITGLVNVDITPEFCTKLGAAYGGILPPNATVLINRDAHYTPRMLKRALISGVPSAGVNVGDVQTVQIPVARYLVHATGAAGGIHVRLSPYDSRIADIKFFDHRGIDIDTATERKIESYFFREDYRRVYLDEIGRISYTSNVKETYISGFFDALRPEGIAAMENFKLVVDYASVDASNILPAVLRRLHCDVVELNANLDETRMFPKQHEFDAGMAQLGMIVPVLGAELGVRMDAGGERMFMVDNRGRRLSGLQMLAIATDLVFRCRGGGGTVAVPVSAPRAFEEIARRHGGRIIRTRTSLAAMMQFAADHADLLLLGDESGHLIFPSFYPTADSLFATVKIMEMLAIQKTRLAEVMQNLPRYFMAQARVACRWENKGKVMRILNERYANRRSEQIDGVRIDLGSQWVLIRPDPDGPFFHVIAEAESDREARTLADTYAELVTSMQ